MRRIQRISEEFSNYLAVNKFPENSINVPEVVNFRQQLRRRVLSLSDNSRRSTSTLRLQFAVQDFRVPAIVSSVDTTGHRWSASVVLVASAVASARVPVRPHSVFHHLSNGRPVF